VVDEWGHYGECSTTCGNGIEKRVRTILVHTAYGGTTCPALDEIRPCNAGPCPTHCEVTAWSEYSMCTVSCGEGGLKTRYRTVISHALHGGYTCPALSSTQECDIPRCPVDCVVSEWGSWSTCSKSCGGGLMVRTRHVTRAMEFGGACPNLIEDKPCQTNECAVDCEVSEWNSWEACSKTCGGGSQTRARTVTLTPNTHGSECPNLVQQQICHPEDCAVDCTVSDWGDWSLCGVTAHSHCAKGKFRQITREPAGGGELCPTLSHWEDCSISQCATEGASGCTHVSCVYYINGRGQGSVQVRHHNEEANGKKHFCKQEEDGKSCACVCSDNTFNGDLWGNANQA